MQICHILDYISYITAVSDGEKTKIVDYDGRLYDTYNEDYGDAETAWKYQCRIIWWIQCICNKFSKKDYKDVWEAEYNDVIIMVSDDTEEYYNIKGERLNKENYVDVTSFNDEGYAIVSEDEENYYAINKDFQKVTDEYNNIKMINGKNWIVKRDGKKFFTTKMYVND